MDRVTANAKAAMPSWDRIEGNWKQFTGKVQERYGIVTDQAERQVAAWMNDLVDADGRARPKPSKH